MRREKTVALAQILGVEMLTGEGTMDLMDKCLERAAELTGKSVAGDGDGDGGAVERAELDELSDRGRHAEVVPAAFSSGKRRGRAEVVAPVMRSGTLAEALDAADARAAASQRPSRPRHKRRQSGAQAA